MRFLIIVLFLTSSFLREGFAQEPAPPLLIDQVTVNQTHIAFTYAGDIWTVERSGGTARALTRKSGENSHPMFSPDGTVLAFSRSNPDSSNVFVMPAGGGETRQLTFIPENDRVVGWTPDGREILFYSHRDEEFNFRLYKIARDGVLPEALPFPQGFAGSYSPDGKRIAYLPKLPFGGWRHYRGGMRSGIWIAELGNGAVEKLPHGDYNDKFPMWIGDKIYFVSDRTGHANLFAFDLKTKKTAQLTEFDRYGITAASAGGGAIVFVRAGRIFLFDPAAQKANQVEVRANADRAELEPKETNVAGIFDWIIPTADGERILVNSRGEVLLFDPKTGGSDDLTKTSGVAERYPAISPDNRLVAYFSDETGEYQLHIRSLESGAVKKIPIEEKPSFYRELKWSPDSKKLVFSDKRLALWMADAEAATLRRIDSSTYSYQEQWFPNWSPDGRWLVYSKYLKNRIRTVFIYDVAGGRTHQITDGVTHAESPVFDQNGKYLYFIWSPNAGTSEYGWGVLNGMMARPLVRRNMSLIVLQKDAPSPLYPNGQPNPEAKAPESVSEVRIDFEDIGRRVVQMPLQARDYARLTAGKPGRVYAFVTEWEKMPGILDSPPTSLYRSDLSKPPNFDKIIENIGDYEISENKEKLLYLKRGDAFLVDLGSEIKDGDGKLNFENLKVRVDPAEEWRQIYREAWRVMRDWFYDPNHHGQDLGELEKHFAEYLPGITRRTDLNALMGEMLGHISVSHLGVGGGDVPRPDARPSRIGLLGADYEIDRGRYRFKKIYRTSQYGDPSGFAPAPLDQPGLNVKEGEYLLSVNDANVDATKNIYSYFENTAGRPTRITVAPDPNGQGGRTLTVLPLGGENGLRRAGWAARNRRIVEEKTGGRIGYIYVANFGSGILDFIRGLTGYSDRDGVIIDQRYNGGGITSDYLIEWLQRNPLYYYTFREGEDIATPVNPGPLAKVLITNNLNFSAAETFAFMYKLGHVGPIVGERTYGGGIGPYVFTPHFIDGGRVRLPNRAAYDPSGKDWGIENIGVAPDFEVEITPRDWMAGRDPQLEKAIEVALAEARKNGKRAPKKPPYPVHP
ncbi:MAG: S41 family peptidase [Pyrinomonadaceae bacterium]